MKQLPYSDVADLKAGRAQENKFILERSNLLQDMRLALRQSRFRPNASSPGEHNTFETDEVPEGRDNTDHQDAARPWEETQMPVSSAVAVNLSKEHKV